MLFTEGLGVVLFPVVEFSTGAGSVVLLSDGGYTYSVSLVALELLASVEPAAG